MILLDVFCNITVTFLSGHPSLFPFFVISYQSQLFLVNGFCYKYYSENILQYLDTSCSENFRKFHGKICDGPILVK